MVWICLWALPECTLAQWKHKTFLSSTPLEVTIRQAEDLYSYHNYLMYCERIIVWLYMHLYRASSDVKVNWNSFFTPKKILNSFLVLCSFLQLWQPEWTTEGVFLDADKWTICSVKEKMYHYTGLKWIMTVENFADKQSRSDHLSLSLLQNWINRIGYRNWAQLYNAPLQ